MVKFSMILSAVALATACGSTAASHVASHKRGASSEVKTAADVAGDYSEDQTKREEWNQNAPFYTALTLTLEPGTAGGTFSSFDYKAKPVSGKWSVDSNNGGINFDDAAVGFKYTSTMLTLIGDHDESRAVFVRK